MYREESLSNHQMVYIACNFALGASLIILTGIKYAKKDVFICDILGLLIGFIFALMMAYVVDKFPNTEYTQILNKLFPPIITKIIAVIYLIYSICLLALVQSDINGLTTTMIMPNTPDWLIGLTSIVIVAYVMHKGIHIFSLSVEILFPITYILLIFIYIVSFFKVGKISNLTPIFSESASNIFKGTLDVFSFPYVDNFLLVFIYSLSKDNFKKHTVVKKAYLMSAFFLVFRSVVVISVLGINEALRFTFPLFETVRLIQIGRYIERLELILLSSWILSTYIKLGTCYYVTLRCIEYLFNLKDYRKLSTTLAIFIIPLSINTVSSTQDLNVDNIVSIPTIKIPLLLVTLTVFIRTIILSRNSCKSK